MMNNNCQENVIVWNLYLYVAKSHFTFVEGYTHNVPSNQLLKYEAR